MSVNHEIALSMYSPYLFIYSSTELCFLTCILPSVCPSVLRSNHLSNRLSFHPFIYPVLHPSIHPFIHLSTHSSMYPSIYPSIRPFIYHATLVTCLNPSFLLSLPSFIACFSIDPFTCSLIWFIRSCIHSLTRFSPLFIFLLIYSFFLTVSSR